METVGLVARFVAYLAIFVIVGAVAFRMVVLTRSGLSTTVVGRGSRRSAALGALASMTLMLVDIVKLGLQTSEMRFPTDSWLKVAMTMLRQTSWGTVWMIQFGGALLLAMMFTLARKDALPRWNVLALMSIGMAATPAFASHAMSAQRLVQYSIPADIAHVLGASLWIGTLCVMFASIVGGDGSEPQSQQDVAESRANYITSLLRSFSPLALTGSALVGASGVVSSLAHIEHWPDLTGTTYGQKLIVKLIGVGIIVVLGFRNWKLVTPGVQKDGPGRMTRGMAIELLLALVVLGITASLVVTPPPAEVMTH